MAENDAVTARINGIAAGGAGLARAAGKTIFIAGTAPGELVRCRIVEERRSWARAELLEIIEASPERVQGYCEWYGICGGCNLQHIRYAGQLAVKAAILQDAFSRIGGFSPPEPEVIAGNPWEYRNRVQFHRIDPDTPVARTGGAAGGRARFGLKAAKSGNVAAVADCPVADRGIRFALQTAARGGAVFEPPPDKSRFTVYARNGLFLSEGGIQRGVTQILDQDITLDAGVFFQSNGAMLELLIAALRETAERADRNLPMADMYCGVGIFARFLAGLFPRVDLVEENKNALPLARENLLPLAACGTQTECFALRDDEWVRLKTGGTQAGKGGAGYGFMVVDPPRQGLSPLLSRWIASNGPPLLAYVSCDPATLARDSKILRAGGYVLSELRLYDFYPQTAHIESLAIFNKN
ncbi:MAG: class I SAM-dependent RNA methyltransferase [Treponema sp.]|jgi:23S rRNA (uracil1939-C5)-methyltransferase|nr:class I SAM-dependent RNA methyltransferase [Treponema sp.]